MSIHKLTLHNFPFESILNKKKDIEGRIGKPKYNKIKVGDSILLTNVQNFNENRTLELEVLWVKRFDKLEEALTSYDPQRMIPGSSFEEAMEAYYRFYPPELIAQYGMVLFGVKLKKVHPRRLHNLRV